MNTFSKLLAPSLFILLFVACDSDEKAEDQTAQKDFCASIHKNDSVTLSGELESLQDSMKAKTGVFVLEDGGTSLITRAWLSEHAEKTIDIQYFIFSTDNIGLIAIDYLVRAAERGVKVRILVDDILVDAELEDILKVASHKNIEIKIYNPGVNLGKSIVGKIRKFATDFRTANQRMHNKTFTVDGQVVITGGRNVADEYFDYDHEYNFRDRDVLLVGKAAGQVQTSFEGFWQSDLSVDVQKLVEPEDLPEVNAGIIERLHQYACNPENFWPEIREEIDNFHNAIDRVKNSDQFIWVDSVQFVSDDPGKNDGSEGLGGGGVTTSALVDLIQSAETSIDIQTPYLITTDLGKGLFREATERGVKVRILTNSLASTDNLEAFSAYQSDRKELLDTGIEIYEFRPDAAERTKIMTGELHQDPEDMPVFGLHAKSMVIDGKTTVIGTFNLDPRSANLNTECISIIHSVPITQKVTAGMEAEFQPENSWQITADFNPDSLVSRSKRIQTWTRKILPKGIL